MLLLVALVGAWLSVYFGLIPITEKRAAYEVVLLTGVIALAFYIFVTAVRLFLQDRKEARRQPVDPEKIKERTLLADVQNWLAIELSARRLQVSSAFLFGSVVHDHYPTNDVDLVIVLKSGVNKSRAGTRLRNDLAVRFKQTFNYPLHLEWKTPDELGGFLNRAGKSEPIILKPKGGFFG